ncbi:hypothetical protein [Psychrobacillus sp. MER TA 171]|uniref:hypothetical protein n=1 Tax=Psychrobacillus sp. MER TA 171 TaxID=2939577 RepID=UPI00203AD9EF|nr:hypothetical protein [Psychrobacillus sp. MER TA 171]MCM3358050.1 hypothetical protein [Psychrobacillus sp. MER TA 171]
MKTDEQLKIEQTVNELYNKYPKDTVNTFLEWISEMTAEEFEATVKLCEIESVEANRQQETTDRC